MIEGHTRPAAQSDPPRPPSTPRHDHPDFQKSARNCRVLLSATAKPKLLRSHEGAALAVEGVAAGAGAAPVYNLRVAEYHTYFVGSRSWGFAVWSHNVNCGTDGSQGGNRPAPSSGKPLHIDVGGEGRYPNASNVNPNTVTSTTGTAGRPIPNHVPGTGQKLPFGNGVADGISLENAPITPATAAEIARVIKPGGSVRLVSPADYAQVAHQRVIDALGGNVVQTTKNGITTTTITVPR